MFLGHALAASNRSFAVAHIHHGLRDEADAEAEMVAFWANKWNAPFHQLSLSAQHWAGEKDSLHQKARKLRYAFFEQLMDENGYPFCLTAHHRDDQAETILMSWLKGKTGALRLIPEKRGRFIRPMLSFSSSEIRQWMDSQQLPYAIDASNASPKYLRGLVRHQWLEPLSAFLPEAPSLIIRRATALNERLEVQQEMADFFLLNTSSRNENGTCTLNLDKLPAHFSVKTKREITRRWLEQFEFSAGEKIKALEMFEAHTGGGITLSAGRLQRTREGLTLIQTTILAPEKMTITVEALPQSCQWYQQQVHICITGAEKGISRDPKIWRLDADAVHFPIEIRHWETGDHMKPLGAPGEMKLSDIFVNEHFSPDHKQTAMIFCDQQGIFGLAGFRMADRVKVTSHTRRLLEIVFS